MAAKTKPQTESSGTTTQERNGNKPAMTFRAKGVKVSIWRNFSAQADGERAFYKTVIQRIYQGGEEFKTTNSLSRDDLPVARPLLQQAWEWILETESDKGQEQE